MLMSTGNFEGGTTVRSLMSDFTLISAECQLDGGHKS